MMVKVLGISEMFPGRATPHVGTFVHAQCRAISSLCEIRFLSPRFVSPVLPRVSWLSRYRRMPPVEVVDGIVTYHASVPAFPFHFTIFFQTLMNALFVVPAALRLRRRYRYDLVHAHGILPSGLAAVMIGLASGCGVVVTSRGSDANVYPRHWSLRRLTSFVMRRSPAITTVSRGLRDRVVALGADPAKTRVIPNGVDTSRFRPSARRARTGRSILFVGRLFPGKGIPELLIAVRRLISDGRDVRVTFVGDGPLRSLVESAADDEMVTGRVTITGFVDQSAIPGYLAESDLLCLPSYHEGWPNVCLEALACGVPVVGTDIEGLREIVSSTTVGILVPRRSAAALHDALGRALDRDWDVGALVAHAKSFSWEKAAESYHDVYCDAVRSAGARGA